MSSKVTVISPIQSSPMSILWNIADGAMPGFMAEESNVPAWTKMTVRGVQFLDKLTIPKKQKGYIFHAKWEMRMNTAFEEVVRACADTDRATIKKRGGATWINEEFIVGLKKLFEMGYCFTYETWLDNKLAGGIWGFQLGSFVNIASAFYRENNASKAAFCRGQIYMQERGFTVVDWCTVPDHLVNFGIEWIPQWKYEQMVAKLIQEPRILDLKHPAPHTPWQIRKGIPVFRAIRGVKRRVFGLFHKPEPPPAEPPVAAAPEPDAMPTPAPTGPNNDAPPKVPSSDAA